MKALLEALAPGSEDLALARAIDPSRIPAHIAIIMDGNGRWAQQRNLPRVAGHKEGVPAVRTTVETCAQLGVGALTLYAFSVENWKRPRLEVDTLWRLLRVYLRSELALMMRHDIRFTAIGRLEELPAHVRTELDGRDPKDFRKSRPAIESGHQLRRPRRARRRREGSGEGGCRGHGRRRFPRASIPRAARSRSSHPHLRRNAHQQFPAVADRLCRALRDRDALAGFHPRRVIAGDS